MTQTPFGAPSTATGTPYGSPPVNQPSTAWSATGGGAPTAPPGYDPSTNGFSDPVITEVVAPPAGSTPPPPAGSAPPNAGATPPGRAARAAGRTRSPRRARLQLRHINPWTVLKFSCVLSVALFFVWLITIGVLFGVLEAAGVIHKINDTVTTINGNNSKAPVTPGIVFGGAAIIGVVNIVLFIALSTVGSVVYNLCADLVGGVEVTLSERDS